MDNNSKISLPIGIFALLLITLCGAIMTLASLTGVGIILSEIINMIVVACVEIWLFFIGAQGIRSLATFLIGGIADGLTGDFLAVIVAPATFILTWYFVNHPQAAQIAGAFKGEIPAKSATK